MFAINFFTFKKIKKLKIYKNLQKILDHIFECLTHFLLVTWLAKIFINFLAIISSIFEHILFVSFVVVVVNKISLCSPGCPGTENIKRFLTLTYIVSFVRNYLILNCLCKALLQLVWFRFHCLCNVIRSYLEDSQSPDPQYIIYNL